MKRLFVIFLIFVSIEIKSKESNDSNTFLLIGEPYKIEFVEFNSDENKIRPSTWKLSIRNVEIIEGKDVSYPNRISVYLEARNGTVIEKYKQIVLKVEGVSEKPELLHWFKPVQVICLPENLVDDEMLDIYFEIPMSEWSDKCRFYNEPIK
ncbi:hypothetical protein ACFODZ_17020 [Marinicella sediminis]|uniref:Uncharacterized protein n=1 Tax=Marinicella sediminis TaxID=1792834 RepID=A0ABV7JGD1_9GAMM|nr:hypothetical protein [Marinicella sediminis]